MGRRIGSADEGPRAGMDAPMIPSWRARLRRPGAPRDAGGGAEPAIRGAAPAAGGIMTQRSRTIEWQDPMRTAAASAGRSGLAFLRAILDGSVPPPPIGAALGFSLIHAEAGVVRFRGEPAEYQYNPLGGVHGGWSCTLLDSAMGSAV